MPALTFNRQALADGFKATVTAAVQREQQLGAQALQELAALADQLHPLALAMIEEMASSPNPAVQQQYLAGLGAIVESKAAELAGGAILAHKQIVAQEVERWVSIAVTLIKAAALAA